MLAVKDKLLKPAEYPGCSGSRNIQDNISDLKAQVAANHKVGDLLSVKNEKGLSRDYHFSGIDFPINKEEKSLRHVAMLPW